MFESTHFEKKHLFADNVQPRNIGAGYIYGSDLKAGAVLASVGPATEAAKTKKSITFTGTPVATKVVKLVIDGNEISYTVASAVLATEVTAIKTAINADPILSGLVTATSASGKLSIEWKEEGVNGNYFTIEVDVGESGLTAGAVAHDVTGKSVGDELYSLADSDSSTSALQDPVAVLLEDTEAGKIGAVAFTGSFVESELKFAEGDSINNFRKALRKIGIFARVIA